MQQHVRIGAVNGTSMKSRNNHEDDASPNTPNLPQSPYLHPLHMEMERIQKEREQITKLHEHVVCPSDLCPFLVHLCLFIYCIFF